MTRVMTRIGPADHGRRMSLDEFDRAEGEAGYLYELSRGVITVVDVPKQKHIAQMAALRRQLWAYAVAHPGQIWDIAGGADCKILLSDLESERHPDLAIYRTPPPKGQDVWSSWVPDLVIEVVSPGSEQRDYVEKREEYLAFGVKEYWVVDAARQEVLVLQRYRGKWKEQVVKQGAGYQTPLFPGLALDFTQVWQAAAE